MHTCPARHSLLPEHTYNTKFPSTVRGCSSVELPHLRWVLYTAMPAPSNKWKRCMNFTFSLTCSFYRRMVRAHKLPPGWGHISAFIIAKKRRRKNFSTVIPTEIIPTFERRVCTRECDDSAMQQTIGALMFQKRGLKVFLSIRFRDKLEFVIS